MKHEDILARQTVIAVLARLNQAHRAYNVALPSALRLQIKTTFYQCYMWLLRQRILFRYDQVQHCYLLDALTYVSMS
ncbi:hypothetical protein EPA93_32510 [Ktedonosporobacter rubrisoli]|uniref:Uncharacterized protein n=1 Tax=Ktedonosporobacter rubrisoli TaxID=2509675 RepID=A0A4P6JXR2_KTERU|nr:hypothetical protein [Ktedonosporobacter rubrisoli]QBD80444.1 hypothetical protein EPA93_32510 [Ktedonosporobacter rubrisoli]